MCVVVSVSFLKENEYASVYKAAWLWRKYKEVVYKYDGGAVKMTGLSVKYLVLSSRCRAQQSQPKKINNDGSVVSTFDALEK